MNAVERVCSAINQEMADADMHQTLSKLSKMWGVDVLSRSVPNKIEPSLNQALLYGGLLKQKHLPSELVVEQDSLPVLFVTKKTQKKAEPIIFKV
jgi:hypothetical protein